MIDVSRKSDENEKMNFHACDNLFINNYEYVTHN